MDAPPPDPTAPLPTDVPTLQAMVRELLVRNRELEARVADLTAKLDAALKHRFGRRSERRPPPTAAADRLKRRRDEHGRSPLPPLLPPSDDPVHQERRRQREEERRAMRHRDAGPVWDELEKWLAEQKPHALPKSPLGGAIGYTLNNWDALKRYLERGYLAIDNNLSERTLRAIALGRNNWGVIGSEVGGRTAAVLYSIIGTCKHLGIDPFAYLREALPGLFALGEKPTAEDLSDWLPDRWLRNRTRDHPIPTAAAG